MLSQVEETNEPTLCSQLGPTELEHGHLLAHGGFSATDVLQQAPGAELPRRDVSCCCHLAHLAAARLNMILAVPGPSVNLNFSPEAWQQETPMVLPCHPP